MDSLQAMGHAHGVRGTMVNVHAIMLTKGGRVGVHEARSTGGAVGY